MARPKPPVHPDAPPEPDELGALSDDAIAGPYRVFQRVRGHRYSLDDVLTAFEAAQTQPSARACLELGTGIGSVLVMLAYKLPQACFTAVEAQRNSFQLLERNVARNGLTARVRLVHGDLREQVASEPDHPGYDLITGTPPYVPPGRATPSSDAQRAYARQEYRGGVEDYLRAAAAVLAPRGRVVVCADARFPERVFQPAEALGLRVIRHLDAVPREGQPALFAVFTLARTDDSEGTVQRASWIARDIQGARTAAYHTLRAFFDMPAPKGEVPSP
jgi:tRNA1(Val) A37 N6-methylase TrmN6